MQQQSAWPATRTDLVGVLCTRRYFNKLVMRSAYVQHTDTNLRRSPDSSVVAVAVLGRSMAVWGAVRRPVAVLNRGRVERWRAAANSSNAIMKYVKVQQIAWGITSV